MIRPAVRYYLGAVLIASPLPLGSNREWAIDALLALTLVVAAATCLARALSRRPRLPRRGSVFAVMPLAFFVVFVGIQVVVGANMAGEQAGVIAAKGDVVAPYIEAPAWLPYSLDPAASARYLRRGVLYLLLFALALFSVRAAHHVRFLSIALILSALIQMAVAWTESTQGFELFNVTKRLGDLTGTFVNRNHFAALVSAAAAAAFAIPISRLSFEGELRGGRAGGTLARLVDLLIGPTLPFLVIGVAATMTVAASGSRGALFALAGCLLIGIPWRMVVDGARRQASAIVIVVFILLVIAAIALSDPRFLVRLSEFEGGIGSSGRLREWRVALLAIAERPITGYGLGALVDGLSLSRDGSLPTLTYDHVHNVYIELLIETGLVGAVLLGWFVFRVLRATSGNLRNSSFVAAEYSFAALLALLVMLFHALVEFNLKIPAISIAFFILSGAMVSKSLAIRANGAC